MLRILATDEKSTEPRAWIIRGAIREDDNPNEEPPTPQDVSPGLARPIHHFFDPRNNRPLTTAALGSSYAHKSLDWASGSFDSFERPNTPEVGRQNHFTLFDARESMFRALTLKWKDTDGSFRDLVLNNASASTREMWRKAYWATTFRSLGNVMHLVQDMAQPQHTRNESHSGMYCPTASICPAGHSSVYEKYIDARARNQAAFRALAPFEQATPTRFTPAALAMGNYPVPSFAKYADYWSTSPGAGSVAGQGLADYSNRGFFTARYNLGNAEYQLPSSAAADYTIEAQPPVAWDGTAREGAPVYVYKASVPDTVTNLPATSVPLTSYGLWDQFIQAQRSQPAPSLNRVNYDAMANLLIPRAVAYSAGLLDYFFRGKLAISLPDAGFYGITDHSRFAPGGSAHPTDPIAGFRGFDRIKVKIRNDTPDITPPNGSAIPQAMPAGTLFAVVKFNRNRCYDDLLANWPLARVDAEGCRANTQEIVVSDAVPASIPVATAGKPDGDEITFEFRTQEIPVNAWNVVLQIVYRGKLGTEDDAVVVATKDISEPTFVTFQNVTDYVLLDGNFYTPADLQTNHQALFDRVRFSCRIGNPGAYTISNACYNHDDTFLFYAANAPAVQLSSSPTTISPRRFGRVALLADATVRPKFAFQTALVNCWLYLDNPFELSAYRAQIDAQLGGPYSAPDVVRDQRMWDVVSCYSDIGVTMTPLGFTNLHQLNAYTTEEKIPLPLTIVGW